MQRALPIPPRNPATRDTAEPPLRARAAQVKSWVDGLMSDREFESWDDADYDLFLTKLAAADGSLASKMGPMADKHQDMYESMVHSYSDDPVLQDMNPTLFGPEIQEQRQRTSKRRGTNQDMRDRGMRYKGLMLDPERDV